MRKLRRLGTALILTICLFPTSISDAEYIIDPTRSELVVYLSSTGIARAFADNHVIRAADYCGSAYIDLVDPAASSLWVEVEADSLVADERDVRQKFGLLHPVNEANRAKIQATVESPTQMDVKRYPKILFRSTSIAIGQDGCWCVTGELTVHGMTRTVSFVATVDKDKRNLLVHAALPFKQSDFGITPYRAAWGAVRNMDEVVLYLDILLQPRQEILASR